MGAVKPNNDNKPFLPMSCKWVQYTRRKLCVYETNRVEQGLVNLNKRRQDVDNIPGDLVREGPSARVSLRNELCE
jgi:hypothetical protein